MATNLLLPTSTNGYGVPLCRIPISSPKSRKTHLPSIFHRKKTSFSSIRSHASLPFHRSRINVFSSRKPSIQTVSAYISAPAADPNSHFFFNDKDNASSGIFNDGNDLSKMPKEVITWKLIWSLMLEEKWRLVISALALVVCTSSTLSMPLFSGKFSTLIVLMNFCCCPICLCH